MLDIGQTSARLNHQTNRVGFGSSNGTMAHLSASLTTNQSVSTSTLTRDVQTTQQSTMHITPTFAPSVLTHPTVHPDALVIKSFAVITPYKADTWFQMLQHYNLIQKYPTLVHDILHGSPISNPPILHSTFIPKNMHSAFANPQVIDDYLLEEIAALAGQMSLGLTLEQAHIFFGGHFCSAPMGVVEQDGKFRVIHNHSALDSNGDSTNSSLDASENATKFYYSASQFAEAVS